MKKLLWVTAVLILVIGGCSKKDALISMKKEKVTVEDFQTRLSKIPSYLMANFQNTEGAKTLLDGLVKERVLLKEAKNKKLNKTKEFKEKIKDLEDQLLVEEIIKELKTKELNVSEQEAQDYFQKNKQNFTSDKVKVSHILFKTESEAGSILKKVREGGDFAELAQKYSIDQISADKGGELDYFSRGEFVSEFEKAAFALQKKGQISNVVKTPFGYHIIKLIDKKLKDEITLSDVEDDVKRELEKKKFDSWMEGKKKIFKVKVNYNLLSEVQFNKSTPEVK